MAFINAGKDGIENLRICSQEIARRLELRYEEIQGDIHRSKTAELALGR